MNWRGRPLTSHEVVVNLIGATTNRKGLTVHAHRDPFGEIERSDTAGTPEVRSQWVSQTLAKTSRAVMDTISSVISASPQPRTPCR